MNDIINILRLEDDSVNVIDITITADTRIISLEKELEPVYCPYTRYMIDCTALSIISAHQIGDSFIPIVIHYM